MNANVLYTPLPSFYIDEFWHLLDPTEKDALIYAARRIFGFGKASDLIAVSQFMTGIVTKEGKRQDHGIGASKDAVLRAIKELARFNIIIIVNEAISYPPSARRAAEYSLQIESSPINFAAMEERRSNQKNKKLTNKIKAMSAFEKPPP